MKNTIQYFLSLLLALILTACSTEKTWDVIIVGGGLMGSSTAWHLSATGLSVLLVEQQDSIYTYGSSMGDARIARSNNRGDDIWSYLHNRSVQETEELIAFLQETGHPDGDYKMEDLYTTSPVTYVGRAAIYPGLYASLERQKVNYKLASNPQEAMDLFGISLKDSVLLVREYNKYSGTVNPQKLIKYLQVGAHHKGVDIRYHTKVTELTAAENGGYRVKVQHTNTGKTQLLKARKVVSAAGPYTGKLLQGINSNIAQLINPQRVFLAYLKIKPNNYHSLSPMQKDQLLAGYPVINSSEGGRMGSFFSMIEYFDEEGVPIIKVGGHFQRSDITDLDKVWEKELSDEEIAFGYNNTLKYLRLNNVPIDSTDLLSTHGYSCVYSLTKTEVPYVSYIPNEEGQNGEDLVALCGLSGVGAKGAMTYGLMAAKLVQQLPEKQDSMLAQIMERMGYDRLVNDVEALKKEGSMGNLSQ